VPSVTVKLISNQDQSIGSVLLQLQHGDERAVRQALHRLFEHVCSETQIDQQLKRQPNTTELARLRLQQNVTLHLAVSKRVVPLSELSVDTSSQAKDACLIAVRESLANLGQPIGNTTDPSRYQAALQAVATAIEQQKLLLRQVGLELAVSPHPSSDSQTHAGSVRALVDQLRQLNNQIEELRADLEEKQLRVARLDASNRLLTEEKERLREELTHLQTTAPSSPDANQSNARPMIPSAGQGRF
jgi:hypothetical protein